MNRDYVLKEIKAGVRANMVRGGEHDGKHKAVVVEHGTDKKLATAYGDDRERTIDAAVEEARKNAGVDKGPKSERELIEERFVAIEKRLDALEKDDDAPRHEPKGDSSGGAPKGKPGPKPKATTKTT